jgi:hypothetical protein
MIYPLFVIGTQRTGTTWLANILCRHSKIAGVQSEPYGIRESAFFSHIEGFFGDLKENNNFIHFIETFGSSDYFRLTGINKDFFYKERPYTYLRTFKLLMNEFTKRNDAIYWIEKTPGHSLYLKKISKYFPDAKYIYIKRNVFDRIKSSIRKTKFTNKIVKLYLIFFLVIHHLKYEKHLENFYQKSNQTLLIYYEELKKDKRKVIETVCNFLNLSFEDELLAQRYKPNTSFTKINASKERESILNRFELKLIELLYKTFGLLPFFFYRLYHKLKMHVRRKRFPDWYWNLLINEKFPKGHNRLFENPQNETSDI